MVRWNIHGRKAAILALAVGLTACGWGGEPEKPYFVASHEDWRVARETACIRTGAIRETENINRLKPINGPSVCGTSSPFAVSALAGGTVRLDPPATLRCSMVPALDAWVRDSVQREARAAFGEEVESLRVAASYACRPRNNARGAKLSEHGYANAFDVSMFVLRSGRTVPVEAGWHGASDERRFLRGVHQGACERFSTVIGPDGDAMHRNHFHMDLARHGRDGTYRVCK